MTDTNLKSQSPIAGGSYRMIGDDKSYEHQTRTETKPNLERMPLLPNRVRRLLPRKQSLPVKELEIPSHEPQPSPETTVPSESLPILPPEIILQILEALPFKSLWFLRGTCQHWNSLAIARAWNFVSVTKMYATTIIQLPWIGDNVDFQNWYDTLLPVVPTAMNLIQPILLKDDLSCNNTKVVIWRPRKPTPSHTSGVTFTYLPSDIRISIPQMSTQMYPLNDTHVSYCSFKDRVRTEMWTNIKRKPPKVTTLFARKGIGQRRKTVEASATKPELEWSMKYVGEYIMGPREGHSFRYQLGKLVLHEVSLPLYQVVEIAHSFETGHESSTVYCSRMTGD